MIIIIIGLEPQTELWLFVNMLKHLISCNGLIYYIILYYDSMLEYTDTPVNKVHPLLLMFASPLRLSGPNHVVLEKQPKATTVLEINSQQGHQPFNKRSEYLLFRRPIAACIVNRTG